MNMEIKEQYCYFLPGDLVQVRHALDYVPKMFVTDKVSRTIQNKETKIYETLFVGVKCRWFDSNGTLQEAVFNTKDLEKIEQ